MILLDTSVLVDGLTGVRRSQSALRRTIAASEHIVFPRWCFVIQESLFPNDSAVLFGAPEAELSANSDIPGIQLWRLP